MRVGVGYDIHRLVEGRKLIIGGVEIPFEKGLLGHSDADVLTHAICDALLGAAALGDIGEHFPDTDPQYRDACSLELLAEVNRMLTPLYQISNIDTIIVAEKPKLMPYKTQMRDRLSDALTIAPEHINIKAKTSEKLGPLGSGEAIAAWAVALLIPTR